MRTLYTVILAGLMVLVTDGRAGIDKKVQQRSSRTYVKSQALQQDYLIQQGFDAKVWLSNSAAMGIYAWPGGNMPGGYYGFEYPQASGIEHLFGAGPWIGAIVDTAQSGPPRILRVVTTGYEGWSGPLQEMFGNPDGRDSFYITNVDSFGVPNRRGFDEDGDGKIDEDELDGDDNDGDWIPAVDDLGTDGLPDSLETGCRGGYDPFTNPDPAYDNWDSSAVDECQSRKPLKSNRFLYTQGNGYPNHGEPHVDEDYGAISESDMYVAYHDYYGNPAPIPQHTPLGIKIWQRSYAWRSRIKAPILPFEFTFINKGRYTLDSVYVGFFADCDVGPTAIANYYTRNSAGYLTELRTAYVANNFDKPSTPAGIVVLSGGTKPLDSLKYTFQWYEGGSSPTPDRIRYQFMTSGIIRPDEYPNYSDTRFFFAFGPVTKGLDTKWRPGDSATIAVAVISGEGLRDGPNNLRDNASYALELYQRGWTTRPITPSPPLKVIQGNDRVTLDWSYDGSTRCDPLQTWDDSDKFIGALPDTHWRRRNPEMTCPFPRAAGATGGRVFEGFRIWRSESPIYNPRSFALIRQYDVKDDLSLEYNTGLEYTLTDSGLVRGKTYWYAVTSFTTPGLSVIKVPVDSVTVREDTLESPPIESDYSENVRKVVLPFEPAERPGKVKVVPNPYRTDADYTYEAGGWEGLGRQWTESKRVVWFIHLPPKCTIRIFTLAGDLVATLDHDDGARMDPARPDPLPAGQEEWNLVSTSGRAIASGIYVYAVEDEAGNRQVDKFVVIR